MLPDESFQFPTTFSTTSVPNGTRVKVFDLNIPDGHVGFLKKMASDWWEGTTIEVIVDGQPAFGVPLPKPLGSFDNPVDRSIVVKHKLEAYLNNNSGVSVSFSIFLDGTIYRDNK